MSAITTVLLDAGANTKLKDKQGKTALDLVEFNWRFADTEPIGGSRPPRTIHESDGT
jgi:hypothetical protein